MLHNISVVKSVHFTAFGHYEVKVFSKSISLILVKPDTITTENSITYIYNTIHKLQILLERRRRKQTINNRY